MCHDIFSQNILHAKTGNSIYCSFSMTSCTIYKNYYEVEFFGKLLEEKESFFFYCYKQPLEVFCEKSCFRKFCKIHRKTPGTGLRSATLLKKSLSHRCFPVNFATFLGTPFFTEHLRITASVISYLMISRST